MKRDCRESDEYVKKIARRAGENAWRFYHMPTARAFYRNVYECLAFLAGKPDASVLNIYASRDRSDVRFDLIERDFRAFEVSTLEFWADRFEQNSGSFSSSTIPYEDEAFDAVLTTKIILEHVSDPFATMEEIARVLKPGGRAYVQFPFFTASHQAPHDYFRFTEWGARKVCERAGLVVESIRPTNRGSLTVAYFARQFSFFYGIPLLSRAVINPLRKHWWLPVLDLIDRREGQWSAPRYFVSVLSKPEQGDASRKQIAQR